MAGGGPGAALGKAPWCQGFLSPRTAVSLSRFHLIVSPTPSNTFLLCLSNWELSICHLMPRIQTNASSVNSGAGPGGEEDPLKASPPLAFLSPGSSWPVPSSIN